MPKKPTFENISLIHMFLDQKTKVNFIESQKVRGLLIPSTGEFHVQVQDNLHNLHSVINTSGQGHKKGITEKKCEISGKKWSNFKRSKSIERIKKVKFLYYNLHKYDGYITTCTNTMGDRALTFPSKDYPHPKFLKKVSHWEFLF